LLLYEGLSSLLSRTAVAGVRNGADVLLKTMFVTFGGRRGLIAFGIVLCGAGIWLILQDLKRHGPIRPIMFAGMMLESVGYALVFGFVVSGLTSMLLRAPLLTLAAQPGRGAAALPLGTQLVVSLGAGIYEELLFRVLLVSGLVALGQALKWRRPASVTIAIVVSAIIFSAFHYIGPYGDALELPSFVFRMIAGVLLSVLYVARGFGITAWTHALYDVALALLLK
jgi:hypothetical protein